MLPVGLTLAAPCVRIAEKEVSGAVACAQGTVHMIGLIVCVFTSIKRTAVHWSSF